MDTKELSPKEKELKLMDLEDRAKGFALEYETLKEKWGMQHGVKNEFVIYEHQRTGSKGGHPPTK